MWKIPVTSTASSVLPEGDGGDGSGGNGGREGVEISVWYVDGAVRRK